MVENQFLERLNLLFQSVMENTLPFGGKQVIFLGDFHQRKLPDIPSISFLACLRGDLRGEIVSRLLNCLPSPSNTPKMQANSGFP